MPGYWRRNLNCGQSSNHDHHMVSCSHLGSTEFAFAILFAWQTNSLIRNVFPRKSWLAIVIIDKTLSFMTKVGGLEGLELTRCSLTSFNVHERLSIMNAEYRLLDSPNCTTQRRLDGLTKHVKKFNESSRFKLSPELCHSRRDWCLNTFKRGGRSQNFLLSFCVAQKNFLTDFKSVFLFMW